MNIQKYKQEKTKDSIIVIHIVAVVACIIAFVVIGFAIYYGSDEIDIKTSQEKEEEKVIVKKEQLQENLLERLENILYMYGENNYTKANKQESLVYTSYKEKIELENTYSINVYVPNINIESEVVKSFNDKMKNTYIKKIDQIKAKNTKTIMSMQYLATVQNNILSVIVSTDLKEDITSQRLLIETFNYDLKNDREISLEEYLNNNSNYNKENIKKEVNDYVIEQKEKNSSLQELGFPVYKRDETSEIYNIKNTSHFFIDENAIYLIYPYGNKENTREIDIVPIIKVDG